MSAFSVRALGQKSAEEGEWRAGTGTIRCRCCYPDVWSGLVTVLADRRAPAHGSNIGGGLEVLFE